jgi:hypothetical protein
VATFQSSWFRNLRCPPIFADSRADIVNREFHKGAS